jgi:hypothetical protein
VVPQIDSASFKKKFIVGEFVEFVWFFESRSHIDHVLS